jgi:hypothetical protein
MPSADCPAGALTVTGIIARTVVADLLHHGPAQAENEITCTIYITPPCHHGAPPFGETNMPEASQPAEENKTMGDKSPKSNQKKSSQKQAQQTSADKQRQQALAAKAAAAKKKK